MILHLDMDAFFAAVEQLDNPELRGKPVIIGGQIRGVVATASYEARRYGIHSAMPMATARKLCAHAIFLRGRYERYSQISAMIMDALREFTPMVQPASIDEAYMDLTGLSRIYPDPENLAITLKKRIREITGGLTCSIGVAPVKFLAKICSDINKPDGFYILETHQVDAFLSNLDVRKLPGVGARMSSSLEAMGITRVGQLRALSREFLCERYGKWGAVLYERAHGMDSGKVQTTRIPKSESAERTLDRDIWDKSVLARYLLGHAERVGASLRKHGLAGRVVTLKIKFADFRQITRSRSLEERINSTQTIYETALDLLRKEPLPGPVRLIGLGVSGFEPRATQLFLPGIRTSRRGEKADMEKRARLDHALDLLRHRFGSKIIFRAGSMEEKNSMSHQPHE